MHRCSYFNINVIVVGSTALIEVVRSARLDIIVLLIQEGANVNAPVSGETPLSIAAETRWKPLMGLLLEYGANPQTACEILQSHQHSLSGQAPVHLLTDVVSEWRNDKRASDISRLQSKFLEAYSKISEEAWEISSGQAETWQVLLDWKRSVNRTAGRAWRSGIGMLRKLGNGAVPTRMNEVIMGITLARSMAAIISETDQGVLADLHEDLTRWRALFPESDRPAFAVIVKKLWGMSIEEDFAWEAQVDSEVQKNFQEMAQRPMEKAGDVFGSEELLDGPGSTGNDDEGMGNMDLDAPFHLDKCPPDDPPSTLGRGSNQSTILWLMAGVIFACGIVALLGKIMYFFSFTELSDIGIVIHGLSTGWSTVTAAIQAIRQNGFSALFEIIITHAASPLEPDDAFSCDVLRGAVHDLISRGCILSFDALRWFLDAQTSISKMVTSPLNSDGIC